MPELTLDWNKYIETAVKTAAEGIVMLENKNDALPLKSGTHVALFGRMQTHYYKSGTGSGGMVNVSHVTDIREGLADSTSVTLDKELIDIYDKWDEENPITADLGWGQEAWSQPEMPLTDDLCNALASRNDAAVIVIARTAGEDRDNTADKGSFYLSDSEEDMLKAVTSAFDRTIVLLNVGNIIDMEFVSKYDIKSVLYVWQGGMIGGTAVARVLTGDENPSGCLTDTIAKKLEDYPAHENFGKDDINEDFYREDIFVGYRYFETFAKDDVLYPFGFGLSYTSFDLEDVSLVFDGENVTVKATVRNTGKVSGKKAVMLYAEAPQGALSKPARVLAGFTKTGCIPAGEAETVTITAEKRDYASFDDDGRTGLGTGFVLEKGAYSFYLGSDIRTAVKAGGFELEKTELIEAVECALMPNKPFKRLTAVKNADGYEKAYEDAPTGGKKWIDTCLDRVGAEIPQTGDKGIKLADVKSGKNTMDEFIAQLTDEDLCLIIRGEGMGSPKVTMGTAAGFGGISRELKALGIPTLCCTDGPSGMRLDSGKKAFALPNGTCLASTFNTELVEELYTYLGIEMVSNKIDTLLGPGINIHRYPLNGRNFEYFSEDPLLTGKMAVAQIKALEKNSVTPTIKHLCANNRETARRLMNSVVSQRAMREIYLPAFEISVREGGARSIMSSYNRISGIYSAGNYDQNTVILREQWGFTGIVMTEWWAYSSKGGEETAEYTLEVHSAMARSQNDVYMVCTTVERSAIGETDAFANLTSGNGKITRAELQRNARNILNFALNTPAMAREEGKEITVEHLNSPFAEDDVDPEVGVFFEFEGDEIVIDCQKVMSGRDILFGFTADKAGYYEFAMTASSDLNPLAQIPMTVYYTSIPIAVITWNGTNGEDVTKTSEFMMYSRNSVFRMHLSSGGVTPKTIRIRYLRPFEEE